MIGQTILDFPSLQEGILLKRYKRFLADIELSSGEIVTAHCANTGPMSGLLYPGGRVRLRNVASPARKLDWSWEQVEVKDLEAGTSNWVGINTAMANKIVRLAIEKNFLLKELGEVAGIKNEVVYGRTRSSRIDLLLTPAANNPDQRKIFIEVKNTTWAKGSLALFPDTVTTRGQKHLNELKDLLPTHRALLIPCITRTDVDTFAPGDSADSEYAKFFRAAVKSGMEVLPCCFGFFRDKITWEGRKTSKHSEFD